MTAFKVVRLRVKPGQEKQFLDEHRNAKADYAGFQRGSLVKTGDREYCIIGEWDDLDSIATAREDMIAMLDHFRDTLEDLGDDLGVTDPVSGEVVLELGR
ncbi:MAG: antibiotic biosynthesis monooxygenase [Arenicellales bacterium]